MLTSDTSSNYMSQLNNARNSCGKCAVDFYVLVKNHGKEYLKNKSKIITILILSTIISIIVWNMIFHNKYLYKFTEKYLGKYLGQLADNEGKPTTRGILLHATLMAITYVSIVCFLLWINFK